MTAMDQARDQEATLLALYDKHGDAFKDELLKLVKKAVNCQVRGKT
jgi:hypothetical protein